MRNFHTELELTAKVDQAGQSKVVLRSGVPIGELVYQAEAHRETALDWALCAFQEGKVTLTNKILLPDKRRIFPSKVFTGDPTNTSIWMSCSSGCVEGALKADYSLVALPGSRTLQKMWVVVLERRIG
jgi:hypothetical protein